MKIMICIPCFGGMIHTETFLSMLQLTMNADLLKNFNIDEICIETISNESLVPRARDSLASKFLEGSFDKLLFIDADIQFTITDFVNICFMTSPDDHVVGGIYRKKTEDLVQYVYQKTKEDVANDKIGFNMLLEKSNKDDLEIDVEYVGCGFMCIDRGVLLKLLNVVNKYGNTYQLFPMMCCDGQLLSEDYAFCELCKNNDIPVKIHSKIFLSHIGKFAFKV